MSQYFTGFRKIDWTLIVTVLFLASFGLAAIYSVALGQGLGEFLNFKKQLIWLVIGFGVMIFFANFDYYYWQRLGWVGYLFGFLLLILVLTPLGSTIRGTRGWFSLGGFSFQPVELMKIFMIIILADLYSRYSHTLHKIYHLIFIGLVVALPLLLVILQPDLGSAMVLFFTWFITFLFFTKNKWHIVLIVALMLMSFIVAWFFLFQDYQRDRILTFIDPSLDPLGRGYNVHQSIIAVGAGRLFGRGLGFGSQSQLKFIPESQTDFIFAVIAEELGFVGVIFIISFFGLIFYRMYKIVKGARDDFGMFLVLLIMALIFVQVFINIGMGVGLLPVTGISLPFVSYGGSFLVTAMMLLGIVLNIHKKSLISRKI